MIYGYYFDCIDSNTKQKLDKAGYGVIPEKPIEEGLIIIIGYHSSPKTPNINLLDKLQECVNKLYDKGVLASNEQDKIKWREMGFVYGIDDYYDVTIYEGEIKNETV